MEIKTTYSGGQLKINKALFSYKMPLDARVENYLNVINAKSTNFLSNACINVEGFSMSFGSKIFCGS